MKKYLLLFRSLLFAFCFLLFALCSLLTSCKKNSFITSPAARLTITTDTLKYDTVFTSIGSITQSFKIINENNQKLLLNQLQLMGGNSSFFKLNINGTAAFAASNIEIAANDSIYIFVSVNINPTTANLPFIISDSILINYNGNNRWVQLQAYGQNAVFLNNKIITGNVTWSNTLPYVILKSLTIDTAATLTIPAGCKIYSHADAPFIVQGSLQINGKKNEEVIFTGDRLDNNYKDLPASWPGLYFKSNSKNNVLKFSIIKNANQAIVVTDPSVNANPKIILEHCIVDNAYDAGLTLTHSSLQINNSLISNCGSNVLINGGGNYAFTNCTLASFSNQYLIHKKPVLVVNNFTTQGSTVVTADLSATFTNNIFWGDDNGFVANEVEVNKQGNNNFNVLFQNNLYRGNNPPLSTLTNNIVNQYPLFDSIDIVHRIFDFNISNANAPTINKGISTIFTTDLNNNNRNNGLPDLGCYEKQ